MPRNTIGSSADISGSRVYSICACGVFSICFVVVVFFFVVFFFLLVCDLLLIWSSSLQSSSCEWFVESHLFSMFFSIVFSVQKLQIIGGSNCSRQFSPLNLCAGAKRNRHFWAPYVTYRAVIVVLFFSAIAACCSLNQFAEFFIVYVIYSSICMFVCRQFYNSIILLSHNSWDTSNTHHSIYKCQYMDCYTHINIYIDDMSSSILCTHRVDPSEDYVYQTVWLFFFSLLFSSVCIFCIDQV